MDNPSMEVDASGSEFLAEYDPAITYWSLSVTGKKRVDSELFPIGIGIKGPGVLRILNKLGEVEEDEMGSFISLTPGGMKRMMKRLMGFGLVKQSS